MTKSILNLKQEGQTGIIDIYGEIVPEYWRWGDEESATHFKEQLNQFDDSVTDIVVNINSPGGDVFEGVAIYNMLKRHKAKVTVNVDGLAASIASVIAMAGDVVRMPSNAMMMVHNALSYSYGNADTLRETAELLDKVTTVLCTTYLDKSEKLNSDTLKALLDAETWLTAEEAFNYGLIDEVITSKKMVACVTDQQLNKFNKIPNNVLEMVETPEETEKPLLSEEQTEQNDIVQLNKEDLRQLIKEELKNAIVTATISEKPKQKFRYY